MKKFVPTFVLGIALLAAAIEAKQFRSATAAQDSAAISATSFQGPPPCWPIQCPAKDDQKKELKTKKK